MRLFSWALKEADPVALHRQSGNFKIAPHKQKSILIKIFDRKMANRALCLIKHNGKSGTGDRPWVKSLCSCDTNDYTIIISSFFSKHRTSKTSKNKLGLLGSES
jgi:hypothetical protein